MMRDKITILGTTSSSGGPPDWADVYEKSPLGPTQPSHENWDLQDEFQIVEGITLVKVAT